VGAWSGKFDVAESFTSPFLGDNLDTALLAGDALETDFLIFAAMAFVVFARSEDLLAEKTSWLWLLRTVVDGLWASDLTMTPATDLFRGSKANLHGR
jgi:hypothetical protein